MNKSIKILLISILCLLINGCSFFESNPKVTFNYNCDGVNNYNCQVMDNKLNCMFIMPECGSKTFAGWYDAKTSGKEVNLDADFTSDVVIYAQWKEDQKEIVEPVEPKTEIVDNTPTPANPEPEVPIIEVPEPDPSTSEGSSNETESNIKYKISFNVNGGTGGQSKTIEVKKGSIMPSISKTIPVRTGYTFMGWFDNSEYSRGEAYYNELCQASKYYDRNSNLILYAGWEETVPSNSTLPTVPKYIISFNANGGTGGNGNLEVKYNEEMPKITSSKPTRSGYTFMGWYDNSDYAKGKMYYTAEQNSAIKYDKTSNITLYAGWKINKYTITFNTNGGTGGQTGNLTVEYDSLMPTINKTIPTRSGYTFMGWYDKTDYTKGKVYYNEKNEPASYYDKKSNLTLYAGWSKIITVQNYTVTFNINGGSGSVPNSVVATIGNNMPTITGSVPTRSGYTFMGWYDNATYTKGTQYYTAANTSTRKYDKKSDTTLYAGWKKNDTNVHTLSIRYNGNGGVWNNPKQGTYDVDSSGTVIVKSTGLILSQKIKYGESLSSSGFTNYNGSYFNWTKTGYYAPAGSEYFIHGTNTKLAQDKVYTASALANYVGCDLSKTDCVVLLKVNWVADPVTYTIKYDCNGGSKPPASQTVKSGQTYTLNANTCTKTYRKFAGWTDATNQVWKNKATGTWNYHNGEHGISNGTLVLKAKWTNPLSSAGPRKPTSKYVGECSSKTSGGFNNRMPFLNVGEYCSFESDTLKYYIDQISKHHRVTYIWVKDAYNQMRVAITPTNADGTHKISKAPVIMEHEISTKGYSNKGLVGVNASPMIPCCGSNPPKTWNGTPRLNLFINEGKVLRYDPKTFWFHQRHYGLASDGIFKDYYMGYTSDLTKADKVKATILNDKVKYTFGWFKPLVKDGKSGYNASNPGDWDSTNMLMALCQFDLNNFAIFSSASDARTKAQGAITYKQEADKLIELGCKYAYGLDSGGSTSFFYKSRSTKLYGPGTLYDNRHIVDIVYFVEQ